MPKNLELDIVRSQCETLLDAFPVLWVTCNPEPVILGVVLGFDARKARGQLFDDALRRLGTVLPHRGEMEAATGRHFCVRGGGHCDDV